jgi:hypothetical protein
MDTTFLPSDYKVPQTGNYMKLKDGKNVFRVMSSAIVGWLYWNEAGKPVRSKTAFTGIPDDARRNDKGEPEKPKHFWAFAVWNPEAKAVQILEVTQKQVMNGLKALVDNEDWGDPKGYDIVITRSGSGFDTEYQVTPKPRADMPSEATDAFMARPVNLEALYSGGDPFAA